MPVHLPAPRRLRAAALLAILPLAAACSRSETKPAAPARSSSDGAVAASAAGAGAGDTSLQARADRGRIQGSADAKVWLVMVSDFQCPYCKTWHDSTYPAITREYVRTGKVRLAYVHLPLPSHAHAWPAAEATMCAAAQDRFWPVHDGVFAAQDAWRKLPDASAAFDSIAARAGVEMTSWRACMSSHAMQDLIAADAERAQRSGINSTPSFIIGNQLVSGAYPVDTFRPLLDSAVAAAASAARGR